MHFLIADDHTNVRRGLREILIDAIAGSRVQTQSAANPEPHRDTANP